MSTARIKWQDEDGEWSAWWNINSIPPWLKFMRVAAVRIEETMTKEEYENRFGKLPS